MQQKNSSFVIDASVAVAYIQNEAGWQVAAQYLEKTALISTINFAEILSYGFKNEGNKFNKAEIYELLPLIIDFNLAHAKLAAGLLPQTKKYGLSLADRACLALGMSLNLPVVTADKIWQDLDIGVKIILIR